MSLFLITSDSLWNLYIAFGNFFLILNFDNNRFFLLYGLPSLLSLVTIIIQIRIIYFVFIKRNESLFISNRNLLKKKILQFYVCYHVFAFFLILKSIILFVDEKFIIIMALLYEIPILIANLFYDRIKKVPSIITISYFVNRFILPFYLKLDEENIYNVHTNKKLVLFVIAIVCIQEFIYYFQVFMGGNGCLPMSIRLKLGYVEKNSIKEIDIKDLIKYEKTAKNANCPICVTNFSDDESNQDKTKEFDSNNLDISENDIIANTSHENFSNSNQIQDNISDKNINLDTDRSLSHIVTTNNENSILNIKDLKNEEENFQIINCKCFKKTFIFLGKIIKHSFICIYKILFKFHDLKDIYNLNFIKNNSEKLLLTSCGHLYHKNCLLEWLDVKCVCPMDKLPLDT